MECVDIIRYPGDCSTFAQGREVYFLDDLGHDSYVFIDHSCRKQRTGFGFELILRPRVGVNSGSALGVE